MKRLIAAGALAIGLCSPTVAGSVLVYGIGNSMCPSLTGYDPSTASQFDSWLAGFITGSNNTVSQVGDMMASTNAAYARRARGLVDITRSANIYAISGLVKAECYTHPGETIAQAVNNVISKF